MSRNLEAIQYSRGSLRILNQLALPHETIFEPVSTVQDGHAAIKTMKTRGAPAIAIVAALSLAVEVNDRHSKGEFKNAAEASKFLLDSLEYLKTSRPTAVNLFDAAAKLKTIIEEAARQPGADASTVVERYLASSEQMLVDDMQDNKNIGRFGAEYIVENVKDKENLCVLTHCNTGYVKIDIVGMS